MIPSNTVRQSIEEALRPGRSAAEYATALRDLQRRYRLAATDWRELLTHGVAPDLGARKALCEDLLARGDDVLPVLAVDLHAATEDLRDRVLASHARLLRERLAHNALAPEPTWLPCLGCGACALEGFAQESRGDLLETDLRCASCGALHLAYGDDTYPLRDLVLVDPAPGAADTNH